MTSEDQGLLAIDTSARYISIACVEGENTYLHNQFLGNKSSALIPPLLDALALKLTSLHGIVYGSGPGSFTGVRIALTCASAIALAHAVSLAPISCFTTYAYQALRYYSARAMYKVAHTVRALITAGRSGYYHATIPAHSIISSQPQGTFCRSVDDIAQVTEPWVACGPGWRCVVDASCAVWDGCVWCSIDMHPDATAMIDLVSGGHVISWHAVDALPELAYMQPSVS